MGLEPLHGQLLKFFAALVGRDGNDALVAVQQLLHIVQNGFAVAIAAHKVGLGELGGFLREGLRVAAGEHRDRTGVLALFAAQPLAAFGEAVGAEQLFQCAGLVQVDLAAKGIKTNSHERVSFRLKTG